MVNMGVVAATVVGGVVGSGAGWSGRWLLGRIRRGVRVPKPWCEVAVAVVWATVVGRAAVGGLPLWWSAVPLLLGWLAVLLTACDVLVARLPDALTLPAYPVAAVVLGFAGFCGRRPELLFGAVAGAVVFAGTYALVRLVSAASLGPGDVKLAGTLGAAVGAVSVSAVLVSMLAAALLTLVSAWRMRRPGVAHGPAMLVPAWLVTAFPPGPALQGGG
jgi:leader peptidase (prepilin peptidase) / N-methyltransferase